MKKAGIEERASKLIGYRSRSREKRIDFSEIAMRGLKKSSLNHFLKETKISPPVFYRYLDITQRALNNYRPNQSLRLYLTDRVLDLAKFYAHGIAVFGSIDNFNYWLSAPSVDLKGQKPIDLIYSRHGLEQADDVIGRIEYGIPA